ncbi:MAG: cobalt-precorrin-5B (C(1))-methyltransferase CbiD [Lachnospiraceae bacterium]|nr:cobalt-precorrin-5B (C(1))-methyltransferase CbiD [Lachnospiraceae bacterium]
MRSGFTTGSCAAAAAKAASSMLLGGNRKNSIKIDTPAGILYEPTIEDINISEECVSCAVRKDSGDDPDITNGILIYACVSLVRDGLSQILIEGGKGVGRVTRPGLDQAEGNAAINSVPRMMIESEVKEVMDIFDCKDSIKVVISVPEGEEIAKKTFNPRLGIEGGISIIGTSGIVEPMSTRALLDTIKVELNQKKALGADIAVVTPGNYGLEFMNKHYGYDLEKAVKCSNYIGETIDMARSIGFKKMLLVGHVGKLIKVSGGIMNTHSHEADCRMELMAAAAFKCGADKESIASILDSLSTEEAYEYMIKAGIEKLCFEYVMERISYYLSKRATDELSVECIVYSNRFGLLGKTNAADEFMEKAND